VIAIVRIVYIKPGTKGIFMQMSRANLVVYLNDLLQVNKIKDSSCNGLQVQGSATVKRIGLAVDACMAVYEQAAQKKCDMLLVHHGIIWNGLKSITGPVYKQIKFLMDNDINLYACHLPLDMNPVFGNNAMLAKMLGLKEIKQFGFYKDAMIGFEGFLQKGCSVHELGTALSKKLGTEYFALAFGAKKIRTVAIVSGGGSDSIPEAIEKNIDCFITGEPSHANHHLALEGKINVLYLGHYQSETVGVKALGKVLEKKYKVETVFIDEPTLV
jgi:dinuclear metal center YbgI/SA1388 family protein